MKTFQNRINELDSKLRSIHCGSLVDAALSLEEQDYIDMIDFLDFEEELNYNTMLGKVKIVFYYLLSLMNYAATCYDDIQIEAVYLLLQSLFD